MSDLLHKAAPEGDPEVWYRYHRKLEAAWRAAGVCLGCGATDDAQAAVLCRPSGDSCEGEGINLPAGAAPPEGAPPTYAEIVDVLREWDGDITERERLDPCGMYPNQRRINDLTRSLLSRIPEVENSK